MAKSPQDMVMELFMHVQTCPLCGSIQPIACEEGRTLAYAWLTWSARHGSKQAQVMLDMLKAEQYRRDALIPPGTQIRRV